VTPDEPGPSHVQYGTSESNFQTSLEASVTNYSFHEYKSGYIHHCLIEGLEVIVDQIARLELSSLAFYLKCQKVKSIRKWSLTYNTQYVFFFQLISCLLILILLCVECVHLINSVICPFQYETKYYYRIGSGDSAREFWFKTPPKVDPDASYKFGIIGKLSAFTRSFF